MIWKRKCGDMRIKLWPFEHKPKDGITTPEQRRAIEEHDRIILRWLDEALDESREVNTS